VRHQEPLPVKLVRRVGELPLTRRQAQVCTLKASGASLENIAEQLGVSKYTTITHGRWIYNKLGVHNRTELVNKLLPS
jgi:DNA-binding CsgD family transcriptional regulator